MNETAGVRRTQWWVRGILLLIASLLALVFYIATRTQPYGENGEPLRSGSHQTLGLPPCRFKQLTDIPCPSCGMTTSFAFLVRGDVVNSAKANWVGMGLAIYCAILIPWCIVSSLRGRMLWIRRVEGPMALSVGLFTVLMLGRWGVLLLLSVFD